MPTGTPGWTLGQEYPYRFILSSAVTFGDQPSVVDFDLTGDLLVIPAAVAEGLTTLFVAVRNAKIVSRVPNTQEQLAKIGDQASTTGCLLGLVGGHVSDIRLAPDLSTMTVGVYRELAARLQFGRASDGAGKYELEEYDGTGKYAAEYQRTDPSGLHYQKRKLRYLGLLGGAAQTPLGPANIVPFVAASTGELTLSPDGRPTEVKATDELTITGAQTPVRSKTTVTLSAGLPRPGQPHDFETMAGHFVHVAADQAFAGKTDVAALDNARIRGRTYDKVLEQLKALSVSHPEAFTGGKNDGDANSNQLRMQELSGLFITLAAIFRQQPETIPRAVAAIRSHSPLADMLVDALGSSGSEAAHKALTALSSSASDPKLRSRALLALVGTSSPSDAAIATLRSRLKDKPFDEPALYGLGTYARLLRDAGSLKQSDDIATLLRETLQRASSDIQHIEVALGGIANCGCDQALPEVTAYLTDGTEGVRVQAVRALQAMRDPKVELLLATRMTTDASRNVRMTAIESARIRPEPSDLLARALSQAAISDSDAHVRYRAVELLIEWLPKRKDVRATLQTVAQNDSEPQVRARAKAAR
jgi:HEAT repeat protein